MTTVINDMERDKWDSGPQLDSLGGYNDFPPNWKPISESDFWRRFCAYGFVETSTRSMLRPAEVLAATCSELGRPVGRLTMVQARLFYYSDGIGLAMVYQVERAAYTTPKFYTFAACYHINKTSVPNESRMCYHVSKCADCGRKFAIDSSD